MVKFFGEIGYVHTEEQRPGVHVGVATERKLYGDVKRNPRGLDSGDKVNSDVTVSTSISVVADAYANEHFFAIRYLKWQGVLWDVVDIVVEPPRLVLRLGGLYNGPIPNAGE